MARKLEAWSEAYGHAYYEAARFIIGTFDRLTFFLRLYVKFLIAFSVGALSALYMFIDFDPIALGLTVISFIAAPITIADKILKRGETHRVRLDELYQATIGELAETLKRNPHIVLMSDRANADHAIYDRRTIPLLDRATNEVEIVPEHFELPRTLRDYAPLLLSSAGIATTDDAKLRLCTDIDDVTLKNSDRVRLQRTSYFKDRVTNGIAKLGVQVGMEFPIVGPHLMVDNSVGPSCLVSLSAAHSLSNQLGGSTLLVTGDRKLVYLQQGEGTEENKGRYAPTGSGSFDWKELTARVKRTGNLTFADFVRSEIERELREESGVQEKYGIKTILVGYARFLYRNGKPEIFAVSFTTMPSHLLSVKVQEWRYTMKKFHWVDLPKFDAASVIACMQHLKEEFLIEPVGAKVKSGTASLPILLNLQIGSEYLADRLERLHDDPVARFFS